LGLIPIHRQFKSFIHKHEVPRKVLHASVGFLALHLYARGFQASSIHPYLLVALVPIVSVDVLRRRVPSVNSMYIRVVGALMRESEVHDRYNGVIWYLLGTWAVLRFLPKDVAVMSVLLLSWCDTAASVIGRAFGRYTPRIRRGKSLAGSAAAAIVGFATSVIFWGWVAPKYWGYEEGFMFKGSLGLPAMIADEVGLGDRSLGGWLALGALSIWSGFVASASEVVDLFGIDDNLTIPVLSGIGLWGFLKVFG
jgi:diacylglycerol kinase (CTP)